LSILGCFLFCLVYFCCAFGLYGTGFWIPQLIKNTGINDPLYVGLLTAIPYGIGAIAMVLFGGSSAPAKRDVAMEAS
jgi:hypothetical protein